MRPSPTKTSEASEMSPDEPSCPSNELLTRFDSCSSRPVTSSYQPFISLFSMLFPCAHLHNMQPTTRPPCRSRFIRGPAPEFRDFVRLKFKNGTEDAELQTLYIFDHPDESVLVTEFIYR
ncbi:hypothetical protein L210DRAFT_3526866, partial [Boletus edulis BED1]